MRTIEWTSQFKRDYRREGKGPHRATLDAYLVSALDALVNDDRGDIGSIRASTRVRVETYYTYPMLRSISRLADTRFLTTISTTPTGTPSPGSNSVRIRCGTSSLVPTAPGICWSWL